MLKRRVVQIGDSQGIIIGKQVSELLNIKKGDFIEIPELNKLEVPFSTRGAD